MHLSIKPAFIFLSSVIIFIAVQSTQSQNLIDAYQYPPSVNWVRINTENFSIVVPKENEAEGQRVANLVQYVYGPVNKTLYAKPKPYTLILSNQNVEANGYVRLAPRMSEWYNTPPQTDFLGTGEWFQMLSVHEMRHMVQYDKFNRGLTKILYYFIGEFSPAILPNLSIPNWFWEGDATLTETVLSNTGRGRLPSFDMPLRTILLSDQHYSYYKSYLGSYKDYTPDNYLLGYHLVTYVRRNFPLTTWSNITRKSAGFPIFPPVFTMSMAHYARKPVSGIFKQAMYDLTQQWSDQLAELNLTGIASVQTKPKKCYTNYSFPQYLPDNSIIAQKYGFDHPYQLVRLFPDGREKKLKNINPIDLVRIVPSKNRLVWSENLPDIRWGNRNYASIVSYDLATGKKKRITRKTKYFAPVLSHDGNRIAAVEFDTERNCSLVILDAETGQCISRLPNPSKDFISTPGWSENDSEIVYTHQGLHGKALSVQDANNGRITTLIPYGTEDITLPVFYDNYIVYNSPFSGIDNIYAIHTKTGERFQLVSAKFGSFNPSFNTNGTKMVFTDYDLLGDEIGMIDADSARWVPFSSIDDKSIKYFEPLIKQEQGGNILIDSLIPKKQYPVEKYSPGLHIFNFHSWQFIPLTPFTPYVFLQGYSNDKLNTTSISPFISYSLNEGMFGAGIEAAYAGLFPVFEVGASIEDRAANYLSPNGQDTLLDIWNEQKLSFGAYVPLNLSRGVYSTQLIFGGKIMYESVKNKYVIEPNIPNNGEFIPAKFYLQFINQKYGTRRDIFPRFAQMVSVSDYETFFNGDYNGKMFSAQGDFYFPGIIKPHSIKLSAAYEEQLPDNYTFPSEIIFPRGYDYTFYPEFTRLSADYTLPLFYTHWNLGPIIYIKRFKADLFYDFGMGKDQSVTTYYNSTGCTVTMEFHPFAIPWALDFGLRTTYLIEEDKVTFEPVLGLYF